MCGETDFVKSDGLFVCQSCGTKYSVEEAKKMMIEGTVEVQGSVQIQGAVEINNNAQISNLMQLARSAYESKNYAQAEIFCNQIIALDANNYAAWKLKGEAINYQITGSNDRIAEVHNCIITSYQVLNDEGKDEHRKEILASLRTCLEGEIEFAIELFISNRPTDELVNKVKDTFVKCAAKVVTSYEELGYSSDEIEDYKNKIKNYYIKRLNEICADCWDNKVYYNYYRGGWNKDYHPTRDIMLQYISESKNLIVLLNDAHKYFNSETSPEAKRENYRLQNLFARKVANAQYFKLMEHTTRNQYGAVTSSYTQWELGGSLTKEALTFWNNIINDTCKLFDYAEIEMAKTDPETQERMLKEWIEQRDNTSTAFKLNIGCIFLVLFSIAIGFVFFYFAKKEETLPIVWEIPGWLFIGFSLWPLIAGIKQAKNDQEARLSRVYRLNQKIEKISKEQTTTNRNNANTTPQVAAEGMWVCKKCGTQNKNQYYQCKKCGAYRTS